MDNLTIKKTDKSPEVDFNINGELKIEGRSILENAIGFYESLITWITEYKKTCPKKLILHMNLEYFNSSSGKLLLILFKQVEQIRLEGYNANIYWYHLDSDEDMIEAGHNFESILKIPFKYIQLAAAS